jgi:ABC-type glycerol-3-phosphate transport system substrate-binding protein
MKHLRQGLALTLVLGLVLSLCACSSSGKAEPTATATPDYTYTSSYKTLDYSDGTAYTPQLICEDGLYLSYSEVVGQREIPDGQRVQYEGQYDITEPRLALDLGDGSIKQLEAYAPVPVTIDSEGKKDFQQSYNISKLFLTGDGKLASLERSYCSWSEAPESVSAGDDDYYNYIVSQSSYYFRILGKDGGELSCAQLDLGDDVYTYNCQLDSEGNLVVYSDSTIYAYAPDGTLAYSLDYDGYIYSMVNLRDGSIGVYIYDFNTTDYSKALSVRVLDSSSHSFGDSAYTLNYNVYELVSGGGDYDFYFTDGTRFYGYSLDEAEATLLFDWIACDVNSSALDNVSVSADGSVQGVAADYDSDSGKAASYELVTVSKVPYSSVTEKTSLKMAVTYLDYNTENAVINFNRSNDQYRIDIVDYSQYDSSDDWNAGLTKLTTEIMAGNMPDILYLSNDLPFRQMAAKGLLEDLYPYIDADSELSRSDFFPNVLSAVETDGKLYSAVSGFSVYTAVGASSVVGSTPGWTYDDYYAALATMPEGCLGFDIGFDRGTVLQLCLALDMDDYVDWQTGTCSFDTGDFAKLLEFAGSFPSAEYYANYEYTAEDSAVNLVSQGKQLLITNNFSSTDFFIYDFDQIFGGSATAIGFPTNNGVGNVITMGEGYAISSTCHNKQAAWEFVRTFLTEDYQSDIFYLPTNIKAFEKNLAKSMEVEYETDVNGNYILDENGEKIPQSRGSYYDGIQTVTIYATTQAQADMLRAAISSASKLMDYDTSILDIVNEQAAAYFAGQKSADEVCKLIQSKVNLYVNEQR